MPDDDRLPRLDDLPHRDDGFDRDAVAAAFSAFEHRIGELEGAVDALRPVADELRALRRGVAGAYDDDLEGWQGGNGASPGTASRSATGMPPPLPRPLVLPRLALEAIFLGLVAALVALADLAPVWIVLVMLGAWLLVAISEWAAFARHRRWRLEEVAPPLVDAGDPSWYVPPVESTMLELPDASESHTIVAALPEPVSEDTQEHSLEDEAEPRRRRLWRRRKGAAAADPWER